MLHKPIFVKQAQRHHKQRATLGMILETKYIEIPIINLLQHFHDVLMTVIWRGIQQLPHIGILQVGNHDQSRRGKALGAVSGITVGILDQFYGGLVVRHGNWRAALAVRGVQRIALGPVPVTVQIVVGALGVSDTPELCVHLVTLVLRCLAPRQSGYALLSKLVHLTAHGLVINVGNGLFRLQSGGSLLLRAEWFILCGARFTLEVVVQKRDKQHVVHKFTLRRAHGDGETLVTPS
mmetsp:Transcript_30414/g.51377  ORF Transcript_30414/g.51377 Transcript_30414/m.51377 type:complete len:236 (+) Transcript_30414:66-773(+)